MILFEEKYKKSYYDFEDVYFEKQKNSTIFSMCKFSLGNLIDNIHITII